MNEKTASERQTAGNEMFEGHGTAEERRLWASWLDETTADYWRHHRMYEIAECLSHRKDAKWLTVGDGRFGLDSIRLRNRGIGNVVPSDISEDLLSLAKHEGLVTDYHIQNAENMTLPDESYDFVFCKESYHHFSRPAIGLYEMLRVAREAVFLVEPNDPMCDRAPIVRLKHLVKRLIG